MEFNEFLGGERLRKKLKRDIVSASLPHAIIIEGPSGSGKRTLARHIALLLNCKSSPDICYSCNECKKVLGKNHTDVTYITLPEGRVQMGIDSVRFMKSDVYIKPNESDYKVYIIESADKMTTEAQNAFLKIFEEPPSYAVFILLCESADALLVTVRSRGTVIRTDKFDFDSIRNYLAETNDAAKALSSSSPDALSLAVLLSYGSIGRAIENISGDTAEKNLSLYQSCREFLESIRKRASAFEVLCFLQSLEADRRYLTQFFDMLETALTDIIKAKLSDSIERRFFLYEDDLRAVASSLTNLFALEAVDITEKCKHALYSNANIQTTITAYAYDICSLRERY